MSPPKNSRSGHVYASVRAQPDGGLKRIVREGSVELDLIL